MVIGDSFEDVTVVSGPPQTIRGGVIFGGGGTIGAGGGIVSRVTGGGGSRISIPPARVTTGESFADLTGKEFAALTEKTPEPTRFPFRGFGRGVSPFRAEEPLSETITVGLRGKPRTKPVITTSIPKNGATRFIGSRKIGDIFLTPSGGVFETTRSGDKFLGDTGGDIRGLKTSRIIGTKETLGIRRTGFGRFAQPIDVIIKKTDKSIFIKPKLKPSFGVGRPVPPPLVRAGRGKPISPFTKTLFIGGAERKLPSGIAPIDFGKDIALGGSRFLLGGLPFGRVSTGISPLTIPKVTRTGKEVLAIIKSEKLDIFTDPIDIGKAKIFVPKEPTISFGGKFVDIIRPGDAPPISFKVRKGRARNLLLSIPDIQERKRITRQLVRSEIGFGASRGGIVTEAFAGGIVPVSLVEARKEQKFISQFTLRTQQARFIRDLPKFLALGAGVGTVTVRGLRRDTRQRFLTPEFQPRPSKFTPTVITGKLPSVGKGRTGEDFIFGTGKKKDGVDILGAFTTPRIIKGKGTGEEVFGFRIDALVKQHKDLLEQSFQSVLSFQEVSPPFAFEKTTPEGVVLKFGPSIDIFTPKSFKQFIFDQPKTPSKIGIKLPPTLGVTGLGALVIGGQKAVEKISDITITPISLKPQEGITPSIFGGLLQQPKAIQPSFTRFFKPVPIQLAITRLRGKQKEIGISPILDIGLKISTNQRQRTRDLLGLDLVQPQRLDRKKTTDLVTLQLQKQLQKQSQKQGLAIFQTTTTRQLQTQKQKQPPFVIQLPKLKLPPLSKTKKPREFDITPKKKLIFLPIIPPLGFKKKVKRIVKKKKAKKIKGKFVLGFRPSILGIELGRVERRPKRLFTGLEIRGLRGIPGVTK